MSLGRSWVRSLFQNSGQEINKSCQRCGNIKVMGGRDTEKEKKKS